MLHPPRLPFFPRACGLTLVLLAVALAPAGATMRVQTGSYLGNGTSGRAITQVGFQPDLVIIKGLTTEMAVCRTNTMSGDATKPLTTATALQTGMITSLDTGGFTVGSNAAVNGNDITYYWIAMDADGTEMTTGSYTGNGSDNRNITDFPFQPDLVLVMSALTPAPYWRSSAFTGDTSFNLSAGMAVADRIQSLLSNGIQVGTAGEVNTNTRTYHYVAWKASARLAVGSYTGDGNDDRDIGGVGFQPEWVWVKYYSTSLGQHVRHHAGAWGHSTDASLFFHSISTSLGANQIQALQADGFQVGSDADVNGDGLTFQWVAFARSSPTAVGLTAFTATAVAGGVDLRWRTGWAAGNLGFHVWREAADGTRERRTPSLLAGSAFLAGDVGLRAGEGYAWWDGAPVAGARYWLEAWGLDGRRTWHGPSGPPAADGRRPAIDGRPAASGER